MSVLLTFTILAALMLTMTSTNLKTSKSSKSKSSPFECGFTNFSNNGTILFSFPFFTISLMFLIFDVEILMICLYPVTSASQVYPPVQFWMVVAMILAATLYEWSKGVLKWL